MTTPTTDPNGWVSNPPSVLVKVVNTTRDTLNGQMAVVLGYDASRTRYVIHLAVSQQQVSLKAENLVQASFLERMRGQVELFQNNADIQRQVLTFQNRIRDATGGRIDSLQKVALLLGIVFLTMVYGLGFSKTLLLLSFLVLVGIIIAPDLLLLLQSGNAPVTPRQVLQNLPTRIRTVIRQQVPVYGNAIADNNLYTAALVGLVLAFFVNALFRGGGGKVAIPQPSLSWFSSSISHRLLAKVGLSNGGGAAITTDHDGPTVSVLDAAPPSIGKPYIFKNKGLLEDAYKRGFDDATNDQEFGTSLEELLLRQQEDFSSTRSSYLHDDAFQDLPRHIISPPPPARASSSSSSSIMSASSIFSILYIGRTLYSAGQDAAHGGGRFDVQLMIANLRTMDKIRLALLGFSIYRLVTPFLF